MRATERLWRTADDRLVADGHLDAEILAYAPGDDVAAADQAKVPGAEAGPQEKARPPAANKSRRPQANKGG